MKKFLSTLIGTTLIALTVLTGCSSPSTQAPAPTQSEEPKSITIEHAMGTTDIPTNPQRVVILTNEGTEALIALGVKPVGAANSYVGEWYPHIADKMEGVKGLGKESEINLEALAALEPDLIIANKMRHEKIYTQLQAIAPTICSDTLRGEWKTNFMFYAKALGKEQEGQKLMQQFDDRATQIGTNDPDALNTKVSLVRFMNGKTRLYLGDTFSGKILKQIGFQRPESQQSDKEFVIEIGKERLQEADGDVMFYYTYETGDGAGNSREQEWLNDPMFTSLQVVKNGKIFKVDDTIWNTSGGILSANMMLDDVENFMKQGVFKK